MHTTIKVMACLFLLGAAFGSAGEQGASPKVRNYEAAGNLESNNTLSCVGPDKLRNIYTPADLYPAVSQCARQANTRHGAVIFALAGAYGRFDTLRVSDKSAHQALAVLKMQTFNRLPPEVHKTFKENVSNILSDPKELAAVCAEVMRLGPPNYFPRYMVQHGISVFAKPVAGDTGLVKDFDAAAAWKSALSGYLHCPNP